MAYPIIAKVTENGEVHQLIFFNGGQSNPLCRVEDAVKGTVITRRDYKPYELKALDLRRQKGRDLIVNQDLDVFQRDFSSSEEKVRQSPLGEDGIIFMVAARRLDNDFSRQAPSATAGRWGRLRLGKRAPALSFFGL